MLAFAHIQKTAGVTVEWILRRSFGWHHCEVEPWRNFGGKERYYATTYSAEDHARVLRVYGRVDSIAGHHVKPRGDLAEVYPGVRYFTFLREPVRRTASHYQHMVRNTEEYKQSCEHWLEDERFHNLQTKHIAGVDDAEAAMRVLRERCFFVGLVERFDESLVLFQRRVGDPRLDVRYRRENVASDSSISRRLLDEPRTRDILEAANRTDRILFDRVQRELFPEQCRDFGPGLEEAVEAVRADPWKHRYNGRALLSRARARLVLNPLARRAQRRS